MTETQPGKTLRRLRSDAPAGARMFVDLYPVTDEKTRRFMEAVAPYMFEGGPYDPDAGTEPESK